VSSDPHPTTPAAGCDPTDLAADPLPAELLNHPRYRLGGLLGRGGMGAVFRAEHTLMGRPVAVKVIAPRLLGHPGAVERFRQEVKAAARLQHPNIVTAYDAEQVGSVTVLVMEYVEGRTLADVLRDRGPLPAAEACEFARQAALGLAHAHGLGMVHRDVKPGNLMLTPDGRVKILDFGLARFVSEAAPDVPVAETAPAAPGATLTATGVFLGTIDYMAPEQAEDARAADPRSDVYALGATLYHLLAGRPPFAGGAAADKLYRLSFAEPTPLAALRPDLPPGLARVVERMLAKAPARRLGSAAEAAAQLAPFAAPTVRRRRWRAALAGLVVAAGVAVAVVAANRPPQVADEPTPPAAAPAAPAAPELPAGVELVREWKPADATVNPAVAFTPAGKVLVGYAGENGVREYDPRTGDETARFPAPAARVVQLLSSSDGGRVVAATRLQKRQIDLVSWDRAAPGPGRLLRDFGLTGVLSVGLVADGSHVVTSGVEGTGTAVWSLDRGRALLRYEESGMRPAVNTASAYFIGDRMQTRTPIARAGPSKDFYPVLRWVRHWRPIALAAATDPSGRELVALETLPPTFIVVARFRGHTGRVNAVAYHPSGRLLLTGAGGDGDEDDGTGGPDTTVRVWDALTGAERLRWEGNPVGVYQLAAADDGRHLLVGGHDGAVRLYRLPDFGFRPPAPAAPPAVAPVPRPPDPTPVGFAGVGSATGFELVAHRDAVTAVLWHPDGKRLVTTGGGKDAVARVWDVTGRGLLHTLGPHARGVTAAALFPDGTRLVTSDAAGDTRVWNLDTGAELKRLAHRDWTTGLAVSPAGDRLLTNGIPSADGAARAGPTARLWDTNGWAELRTFATPAGLSESPAPATARAAFLPGGKRAVTAGWADGSASVWDVATGTEVKRLTPAGPAGGAGVVRALAALPDGKRVLVGGSMARLWDVGAGAVTREWQIVGTCDAVAADPTACFLAGGGPAGETHVWDAKTGTIVTRCSTGPGVYALAFAADGRLLAAGCQDGTVSAWVLPAAPAPGPRNKSP